MIKPRSVAPYPSDCAKESFANSILDEREFLTELLLPDLGFLREKSYQLNYPVFQDLPDFSLRSRSRIASSTRRSARLASCSCASADCVRNSKAVTLSSAAAIRASASVKAFEASCNLRSASLMTSRRAFSATSRRFSASCALSAALLQTNCARASVSRTCSYLTGRVTA